MFNIHLLGDFKNLDQLTKGRFLTHKAVQFEEGNSFRDIIIQGLKIVIPLCAIMVIMAIIRLKELHNTDEYSIVTAIWIALAAASTYLLAYVHEFIHALCYPLKAEKQVWRMLDQGAFFVYCESLTSKTRFILMSFAPALILGIIPYIFWLIFPTLLPFTPSIMLLVVSILMTVMAMGDYVNIYNAIVQVPKNAQIFNFGFHSYWIEDLQQGEDYIIAEDLYDRNGY